jgi:hypothetical protein
MSAIVYVMALAFFVWGTLAGNDVGLLATATFLMANAAFIRVGEKRDPQ